MYYEIGYHFLNEEQRYSNAREIYAQLSGYGWTHDAICGVIANADYESLHLNPAACERGIPTEGSVYYAGGIGLTGITDYPAYTATRPNPLLWYAKHKGKPWYDGEMQVEMLTHCMDNFVRTLGNTQPIIWGWQTSNTYPSISFGAYKQFNGGAVQACEYWYYCYEWHWHIPDKSLAQKKEWAQMWSDYFDGTTPEPPEPQPPEPKPPLPEGTYWIDVNVIGDGTVRVWYGDEEYDRATTGHVIFLTPEAGEFAKFGYFTVEKGGILISTFEDHYMFEMGTEDVVINAYFTNAISPSVPKKIRTGLPVWMMLKYGV